MADHDDRDDRERVPVDAELRRCEHCVAVGAEAVERDVAEVEQPRIADDDVQAEREQHVQQRVEADADDIAVVRERRQQRCGDPEREVEHRPRHALELTAHVAGDALAAIAAPFDGSDPFVDADPRRLPLGGIGHGRRVGAAGHQTFCTAARPSTPLGLMTMTTISTANTIASLNVEEM